MICLFDNRAEYIVTGVQWYLTTGQVYQYSKSSLCLTQATSSITATAITLIAIKCALFEDSRELCHYGEFDEWFCFRHSQTLTAGRVRYADKIYGYENKAEKTFIQTKKY